MYNTLIEKWHYKLVILISVFLLVSSCAYLYFIKPLRTLIAAQANQIANVNDKIYLADRNLENWSNLQNKLNIFSSHQEFHDLLAFIDKQADKHRVSIISIKAVPTPSHQLEAEKIIEIIARANFFALLDWLQSLVEQRIAFGLQKLIIAPGTDQQFSWLEIKLTLNVFQLTTPSSEKAQ